MLNPFHAAKHLCESNKSITNLRLQKVLYIAHMFCLGQTKQPLISGNFEAWDLGPVHVKVYHKAKIFGNSPIDSKIFRSYDNDEANEDLQYLDSATEHLKNYTTADLVAFTHRKNGAWHKNYQARVRGIIIPNSDILKEYNDKTKAK
ncbi:MAG: DUF4065 domain-containing protein [Alphaproteobacteria bacterium]|nr:DUF4065 domain-containing protein [Alphaproteobacteria bacterium]